MEYTPTTWDDAVDFYKAESKADHDLRAIAGKWMHKLCRTLRKDKTFNVLAIGLNGWTLVLNMPDSKRSIYAFCEEPGRITIYIDHCGDTLETFFGEHQTVEIEDAPAALRTELTRLTSE